MKKIIQNVLFRNGLYAGGILAVYFLVLYLIGLNFFKFGLVSFLIEGIVVLYFMFTGISQARKMTEEKIIKYPSALLISFGVMFIGLMCFAAMELFVLFVLDPSYLQDSVHELQLTMVEQIANNPKLKEYVNPDDISKLLEFSTYMAILLKYLIKSLIVSALVALIAKKKDRLEDSLTA